MFPASVNSHQMTSGGACDSLDPLTALAPRGDNSSKQQEEVKKEEKKQEGRMKIAEEEVIRETEWLQYCIWCDKERKAVK